MANKQISQLNLKASVVSTDQFATDDNASVTWKVTAAQLLTFINTSQGFTGGILAMANGGTNANLTAANGAIPYSTATAFALLAAGTSGQLFQSGGAGAPHWTTPTFPSASGTAGQILISNGTNNVYSTPLWPTAAGTTGSLVISDGTNKINSTSLWPNTVGTVGKLLRSDGTVNAYSTLTMPDTLLLNGMFYASSANVLAPISPVNSAIMISSGGGVPSWSNSAVPAFTMAGELTLSSSSPSSALVAASKGYVDATAQGRVFKDPCVAATTADFSATYSNGSSGVGATLTGTVMAAFAPDGVTLAIGDRVLFKDQASTFQNGIYVTTTLGTGAVLPVFTRSTDMDLAAEFQGATTFIIGGTVNTGRTYTETAAVVTIGTDAVTFSLTGDASGVTSVATAGLATGGPITSTGTVTVTAAVQADQETATSNAVAVTPGVQQYHPSALKAWVYFGGGATPSIVTSYNFSSVTDGGVGIRQFNYTVAMSSANNSSVYTCDSSPTGTELPIYVGTNLTTSSTVLTFNCVVPGTPVLSDAFGGYGHVTGDQ